MSEKVLALIDCNNFYVSCERVFHAAIQNTPTIVLSNNDGCVVARGNEAKKLGIKMGQPAFEVEALIKQHHIQVFSSNYSLYADLSRRVMSVLAQFSPRREIYSIDEAWLDLTHLPIDDLTEFGRTLQARVLQQTGIPVSVGIASTKSLTKIATELVKSDPRYQGVLDLTALAAHELDELLAQVAIHQVWGIGRKYALFLDSYGITSARALKYADEKWIRRYLTVSGARIVLELRGIACFPLELERPPKQGIMCAKTFGREITSYEEMREAIATYTARAAEKLREQDSLTSCLTIFLRTNSFKHDIEQYANSFTVEFAFPTAFTPDLLKQALAGLKAIYKEGYRYYKAGVSLTRITPQSAVQPDLFGAFSLHEHERQARLMFIVDAINRIYGHDTLCFAVQGMLRPWKMRQARLSKHFTTRWDELLMI